MKRHINSHIYNTFYIMKDINYLLNNPLDTRNASRFDMNIRRYIKDSKISRNSNIKLINSL